MADCTRDNAGEENSAIFMKNVSNIGSLNINNSGQVTNIQGGQYNYSTTIPKAKNQTNDENEQQNYNEFSGSKPSQNGIFLFLLMNYVEAVLNIILSFLRKIYPIWLDPYHFTIYIYAVYNI